MLEMNERDDGVKQGWKFEAIRRSNMQPLGMIGV